MANTFGKKLGILGGGQLARMLALSGQQLGLEIHVLSASATDPAAQVVRHHHKGNPHSLQDYQSFIQHLDFLTFESEFIDAQSLEAVKSSAKTKIFPNLHCMRTFQDRQSQKIALTEAHIPTAPFMTIHDQDDLKEAFDFFKGRMVLKKRRGGYDGNGTFIIKNARDLKSWKTKYSIENNEWIAEAFIPFKRECAFSMARNASGEMVTLPLVETKQTNNRCDLVWGPIQHKKWDNLVAHCAHLLEDNQYEGIMAFELFDTGSQLIVNELAPRVHNSGHHSLNSLNIDQFTLHLKAGLDLIFYEVKPLTKFFAMTNLIGTSTKAPEFPLLLEGNLHWYGKLENRDGRKMGHVNYTGNSLASLKKKALTERKKFKHLGP